jgi:hypothetical protein
MDGKVAQVLVLAAAALGLGGCGVPAGFVVAGYVADGASYLATGKSATDHALSAAADRDCAMLRVTIHEPVCRTSEKNRREERAARNAAMAEFVKASAGDVAAGKILLVSAPEATAYASWGPPESGLADATP